MADSFDWELGIEGRFPLHKAVVAVIPSRTKIVSSDCYSVFTRTKTAKVSVILPDGTLQRYFLKCGIGQGARPLTEGEYHSASAVNAAVPGFAPNAVGWGEYHNGESKVYFYLGDYHDMDLKAAPEPASFTT
ncbi:hypothetical protein LSUB1_G008530 [Lachnellula subtilissima]|uniref:Uncharacterized protein n=1 Tax=Lachnellula subtilissima TaxID=602034 RepID=A0A8H8RC90_9HELO|nr:hypothetical protein LSUB1_G008530 [Lachnellula subtilissima]